MKTRGIHQRVADKKDGSHITAQVPAGSFMLTRIANKSKYLLCISPRLRISFRRHQCNGRQIWVPEPAYERRRTGKKSKVGSIYVSETPYIKDTLQHCPAACCYPLPFAANAARDEEAEPFLDLRLFPPTVMPGPGSLLACALLSELNTSYFCLWRAAKLLASGFCGWLGWFLLGVENTHVPQTRNLQVAQRGKVDAVKRPLKKRRHQGTETGASQSSRGAMAA